MNIEQYINAYNRARGLPPGNRTVTIPADPRAMPDLNLRFRQDLQIRLGPLVIESDFDGVSFSSSCRVIVPRIDGEPAKEFVLDLDIALLEDLDALEVTP